MSAGLTGLLALQGVWLASPPVVAVADVPRQVSGGKGRLMRPQYDHIVDMRPGATSDRLRQIRRIDETLRKVTRNEGRTIRSREISRRRRTC